MPERAGRGPFSAPLRRNHFSSPTSDSNPVFGLTYCVELQAICSSCLKFDANVKLMYSHDMAPGNPSSSQTFMIARNPLPASAKADVDRSFGCRDLPRRKCGICCFHLDPTAGPSRAFQDDCYYRDPGSGRLERNGSNTVKLEELEQSIARGFQVRSRLQGLLAPYIPVSRSPRGLDFISVHSDYQTSGSVLWVL